MNEMSNKNEIRQISVQDIIPNRFQPRLVFDERKLQELANSIKIHGIIQPLVLRPINDKYEIIVGERRYKAACMAGFNTVPAIVMNIDDKKSAELAVVENLQRKNLSPIEEAQSYKKLLDKGYLTQEELALKMGVSQPTIANKIRLLSLEKEVQDALLANKISERHARSLLSIDDALLQVNMLNRIINERLTVRQADEEINKLIGKEKEEENNKRESIFDLDLDKVVESTENIIKPQEAANIDELIKPQSEITETDQSLLNSKKINLEDEKVSMDMGEIAKTETVPFNPFTEEPEVMEFFNAKDEEVTPKTSDNPIINEFREMKAQNDENVISDDQTKPIFLAINKLRDFIRSLEDEGYKIDTEEFDFEDMYQIITKIKKE